MENNDHIEHDFVCYLIEIQVIAIRSEPILLLLRDYLHYQGPIRNPCHPEDCQPPRGQG